MLELRNCFVDIGMTPVLRDVTLTIAPRRFTGLVGRNGAGKTTLLRTLMGLIPLRRGTILFDGKDLASTPSHRRVALAVGYMPEDRRLVPGLTVRENISLPSLAGQRRDLVARLAQAQDLIPELRPLMDRKALALSGGQQKLVALARALMVGNRLLLLDEPTEGVAPALAHRILEILATLKDEGWSVLVAESNEKHLTRLTDSLLLIERGVVSSTESGEPRRH